MSSRILLRVAVVGALLVGGATTASTRASWTDQANLASSSVSSGTMSLAASAAPATLSVAKGSSATSVITVGDTSSPAAKNLVQRITPAVTGTLPAGVTATLTTRSGGTCTGTAQSPVTTTPGGSLTTCLNVTVANSATATSATVTVGVTGQQMRAGSPAGWSTPTQTVSVPVSITGGSAPSAPVISCGAYVANGTYSITWTAASGVTYSAHRATGTNTDAGYTSVTTSATSPYPATVATGVTTFWRLRATNASGTSGWSNTIQLTRSGNGATNHTCMVLP